MYNHINININHIDINQALEIITTCLLVKADIISYIFKLLSWLRKNCFTESLLPYGTEGTYTFFIITNDSGLANEWEFGFQFDINVYISLPQTGLFGWSIYNS